MAITILKFLILIKKKRRKKNLNNSYFFPIFDYIVVNNDTYVNAVKYRIYKHVLVRLKR